LRRNTENGNKEMNALEKFDREQLETWITMCDEKFDALKVPDNQEGALLSISGRLGTYIESNESELAALRAQLKAHREQIADANELLLEFTENPNIELGEKGHEKIEDYFKKYSSNNRAKMDKDVSNER